MPTMEITTMVGCPLMCTFCPQDELTAAYGKKGDKFLTLLNFKTILDKIPPHVRIDFSGMAEPWANPDATEMLAMTLAKGHQVAICTTLQGIAVDDSERIINLIYQYADQVMEVSLHLPDSGLSMRGYKGSNQYLQVLKNFLRLAFTERFPSHRLNIMTMDKDGAVHRDLSSLIAKLPRWKGHSWAGSLNEEAVKQTGATRAPKNQFALGCSITPFYDHNVLLPNGDVVLCCMDYSLKHIIGNLLTSDYYALFASRELGILRAENQKQEFSKCSICKTCERVVEYTTTDASALWDAKKNYKGELYRAGQSKKQPEVNLKDVIGYFTKKIRQKLLAA